MKTLDKYFGKVLAVILGIMIVTGLSLLLYGITEIAIFKGIAGVMLYILALIGGLIFLFMILSIFPALWRGK